MGEARQPVGSRSWQRSATEDLWKRTLAQIPTKFGQLAYLSRLRNPETERYEHHGLNAVFGEEAAEQALQTSHWEVLESFLALSLLDQRDDVERYLEASPLSVRRVLTSWEKTRAYLSFLPTQSTPAQKELFDANLQLMIRHLRSADADERPRQAP